MYYLRAVRNRSSFVSRSFDLAKASNQLSDRDGGRASVFRISNETDADRMAVYSQCLSNPVPNNWIMFSYLAIG
jgi:hypothetical protein